MKYGSRPKGTARIDNWYKHGNNLIGRISNHPNQQNFHSELGQITSDLVAFEPEHNRAETQNTYYELGTPYVHP